MYVRMNHPMSVEKTAENIQRRVCFPVERETIKYDVRDHLVLL